jgi:endonuclease/exonuclease/phosphatase family metal-dependent hydrolase
LQPIVRLDSLGAPVRKLASVLVLAASTLSGFSPTGTDVASSDPGSSFSILQMNLCLSGQAGCYEETAYPSVVDEATAQIAGQEPDAVTLNEACRGDAADLARRTGYALSFAAVNYGGTPLPCINPRGRGVFGIAVLTKDHIATSESGAFAVQADPEERRWLCATTDRDVTVCTAHLSTRYSSAERVANDAGCRELRSVLARHEAGGTTLFGGDVNRQDPCAPSTMWVTRDTSATQSPGVQHIYGTTSVKEWSASVAAATYTDHDFLLAGGATRPSG